MAEAAEDEGTWVEDEEASEAVLEVVEVGYTSHHLSCLVPCHPHQACDGPL